jgi:AraC family transcriptional regulator
LSDAEFSRSARFADVNVSGRLDLATWAAELNMTSNEFGRRFRLKTGVSPYHWLLDLRIDRATMLLENSTLSLAEIALQVGFSSQSHFTDVFRRRCGIAPGHWRKRRTQ